MAVRTDNLPQATTLSLTDEFIGNTSLETVRATLQVLLTLFSANLITSGTSAPTSETAGLIYMMVENGAISTVYGKVNNQWLAFSSGGGGGSTVAIEQIVTSGTELAQLIIDGVTTSIYAPSSGGATRELIGDFDISTTQSGNLTTTKDMSQYDILEIEWIEKGNRWTGGYWANEHIMFARYKTSDPKDPNDTSGLFYSSSTGTSMAYTGDIGMAVRFVDTTTLVNMQFSNAYISKIWGIKY